jgi:putative membrane protein
MRRILLTLTSTTLTGLVLTVLSPTAQAAAPSAQDQTFMQASAQTNLAEIAIGKIALSRAKIDSTIMLANKTISDHQLAQSKLETVSKQTGVALPSAPNATQQAQAAQLQSVAQSAFDLTYDQIQVSGHQLALSQTDTEISSGSDATVKAYAQQTRPVIAMHLSMAQANVAALTGTPGVPAGTGGSAATRSGSLRWLTLSGMGVAALLAAGLVLLRTRRLIRSS